jgi:predicted RNA binding protein YcfA (HicA-like mRNA interferase family)
MPEVPLLSGSEIVKTFENLGWRVARMRGSHIIMVKEGQLVTLSIPAHNEVARGTLHSLIRLAGLTVVEFVESTRS